MTMKIFQLILDLPMFFWQISQIRANRNDKSREKSQRSPGAYPESPGPSKSHIHRRQVVRAPLLRMRANRNDRRGYFYGFQAPFDIEKRRNHPGSERGHYRVL